MDNPEPENPSLTQISAELVLSSEGKPQKVLKDVSFDANGYTCFAWRPNSWKEVQDRWDSEISNLKLVTFNILFDLFDKDREETLKRQQRALALLQDSNADLIALQEVTPGFLEQLLQEQWVQQYYLSDITAASVSPYGQLFLSRFPFRSLVIQYTKVKRVLLAEALLNGRPLHMINLHLTSAHQGNRRGTQVDGERAHSVEKRARQVRAQRTHQQLAVALQPVGQELLMLGDFNIGDGEAAEQILPSDLLDLWRRCCPDEAGFTYDPERNPLAKAGSPSRYDRILMRSNYWLPQAVAVLDQPADGPSDHYALTAELEFRPPATQLPHKAVQLPDLPHGGTLKKLVARHPVLTSDDVIGLLTEILLRQFDEMDPGAVFPVGSHPLGLALPSSAYDLLVVGPKIGFMPGLIKDIRATPGAKHIEEANGLLQFQLSDQQFTVRHASLVPATLAQFTLDAAPKPLAPLADFRILQSALRRQAAIQTVALAVRQWAAARELYSAECGFPGGYVWTVLVAALCERHRGASAETLFYLFFAEYSEFAWAGAVRYPEREQAVHRDPGDAVAVFTLSYQNVASHISADALLVMARELRQQRDTLAASVAWSSLFVPLHFPSAYRHYLVLTITSGLLRDSLSVVQKLRRRLPAALAAFQRRCGCRTHPCSQFFQSADDPLSVVLLFGLRPSGPEADFLAALQVFQGAIDQVAQSSPTVSALLSTVTRQELHSLVPLNLDLLGDTRATEEKPANSQDRKLGTSEDVFNRIKWDPALDKDRCLIGYLDRFKGEQEMLFENWRRSPIDIIPWHRVLYYKIGGELVWDKRTRVSLLS